APSSVHAPCSHGSPSHALIATSQSSPVHPSSQFSFSPFSFPPSSIGSHWSSMHSKPSSQSQLSCFVVSSGTHSPFSQTKPAKQSPGPTHKIGSQSAAAGSQSSVSSGRVLASSPHDANAKSENSANKHT